MAHVCLKNNREMVAIPVVCARQRSQYQCIKVVFGQAAGLVNRTQGVGIWHEDVACRHLQQLLY